MNGIYYYTDKTNGKIVYVGKDSYLGENRRQKQHLHPSRYDAQPFNRILQNNPDRYEYGILKQGNFDESLLTALEIIYIRRYRPRFCYTIGGDGVTGYKHTPEAKKKISETHKGKTNSEETRKKISQKLKGRTPWNKGKKNCQPILKGANTSQWKDYARVIKKGKTHNGKKNYVLKYEGKEIRQSIYYDKLQEMADEINKKRLQEERG